MFDDQDLVFLCELSWTFIFLRVTAYYYVMADPKYEGN
ncbi:Dolichyl-diphosphooligosaccharide--protein glycosyltransferase subunit 4A [Turnera subulata]|uniref:Dolichyl-diphosphooligosaccharide--protein glycosyltransferase subunit 4A n=1 Tax=Turnera subulata TaxID=218843 RepID=A0A9Q0G0K7_9ROSI|nr:Dolichyl-diphosphooligosaccharide--protein glycosyltransferase subunit 4A [Turnera subulata]